jgi:hypothetical protein
VIKQISSELHQGARHKVMIPLTASKIDDREMFQSRKEITVIDESKDRVLFESEKIEIPREDSQIKMRAPLPPEKVIEFHRRLSKEPFRQGAETRGDGEKDTIIFLDKHPAELHILEPTLKKVPDAR